MKIFLALMFCGGVAFAQPAAIKKIAQQASVESLKKNLYYLASNEMQGRLMASRGDTLASLLVAKKFRDNKLAAPYNNGSSYFQDVKATRIKDETSLIMNGKKYADTDGWNLFSNVPVEVNSAPVFYNDFQTIAEWNQNLPSVDVKGKAVILHQKLFADDKRLDSLENALTEKGAKLIIWTSPMVQKTVDRRKLFAFLPIYQQGTPPPATLLPEVALIPSKMQELLSGENITVSKDGNLTSASAKHFYDLKATVSVSRKRQLIPVTAPNVIGVIKGTDPNAPCVIISAHHDHDGMNGKTMYPGAVDNASGTVAIMEVAALMNKAVKQGLKPKRTIVFASYTGEERGLIGSFYYANNPVYPVANTYAVINVDMLGRVDTLHANGRNADSNYAYILVKDTLNRGLRKALFKANEGVKLTLDTHYELPQFQMRRVRGSDQYPLYEKGIPFVRIDCGFAKEYHKPEDTPDKIDYNLLTKQTQLVFLTLWNMAND